jgi:toxin ParE1/3/4
MRLHLDIRPSADADLAEIAEYIAKDNIEAAIRFLESARRSMEFLTHSPKAGAEYMWSTNRRLRGVRKWSIDGFRQYLIFYRITTESIEIIRVVHGARDLPAVLADEI